VAGGASADPAAARKISRSVVQDSVVAKVARLLISRGLYMQADELDQGENRYIPKKMLPSL